MNSTSLFSKLALALLATPLCLACADVLGFKQARLDPELEKAENADGTLARDAESPSNDAGRVGDTLSDSGVPRAARDAQTDAAPSAPEASVVASCDDYCELVMSSCNNEGGDRNAVYDSSFSCRKQCEEFPTGTPGDGTGNSLACRATHAQVAAAFPGEAQFECPAAGPGGDGICGSNCEGYCSLMEQLCPGSLQGDCLAECAAVPDLGGFDVSQIEGNSIQCRFYHLGAATASPALHCRHAAGEYPCSQP